MDEIWKPIPDYPAYEVSNFGRVKSFWFSKPRILKPALTSNGYLFVTLCQGGKQTYFSVHRLVALTFIPNPESKPQVNHIDGNKLNNFVGNLEWATQSENVRHAVTTGLQKSGQDSYQAKLTNEQVLYIRSNPNNLNIVQLGEEFGVDQGTISDIQLGKKWKHVGGVIRGKKQGGKPRVSDNIRVQIRAEYIYGSSEFGSYALAKKYGVTPKTIINIIHESL